jgi:hypothetical protein
MRTQVRNAEELLIAAVKPPAIGFAGIGVGSIPDESRRCHL